jgi:DNA-binding beta-propeller fold protein YncE
LNDVAAGKMYAGDVSSVKVINTSTNAVTAVINGGQLAASGVRADEGCVGSGPAAGTYIISSPEAAVPFMTVINTATDAVIATITFSDLAGAPSAGLEQCRYDAVNDLWFVNNDGTTANPHGELDALPGASIRAIAPGGTVNYTALAGVKMYPMTATPTPGCDPTGLALGPGTDIAIMCREGTTGAPLLLQILNRLTGAIVASLNAGGGDQLEYDPTTNRYYGGNSRWTSTGLAGTGGACSATSLCTPTLSIVDAGSRTVVAMLPTGNNAHSVAVDPASGLIFMPFSSATSPAGCGTCAANGFTNGGVLVFRAQ